MRILVATDAYRPQVNGVVRSLEALAAAAPEFGAEVDFLRPDQFATVPLPTYREIRLALAGERAVAALIAPLAVDHIHVATEGPVGLPPAASASSGASPSRPATTPAFPNMSRRARPCRRD